MERHELLSLVTRQEMEHRKINVPRSRSVINDKRTITNQDAIKRKNMKKSLLEAQEDLKNNKVTIDDIKKYYCDYQSDQDKVKEFEEKMREIHFDPREFTGFFSEPSEHSSVQENEETGKT